MTYNIQEIDKAIMSGDINIIKDMLEAGIKFSAHQLDQVIKAGQIDAAIALVKGGAVLHNDNSSPDSVATPKDSAIKSNSPELVKAMIEKGAKFDVFQLNKAIQAMQIEVAIEIATALAKAGTPLFEYEPYYVNAKYSALQSGSIELIKAMFEAGVKFGVYDIKIAVVEKHTEIATFLVKCVELPEKYLSRIADGPTIKDLVVKSDSAELLEAMIKAGVKFSTSQLDEMEARQINIALSFGAQEEVTAQYMEMKALGNLAYAAQDAELTGKVPDNMSDL